MILKCLKKIYYFCNDTQEILLNRKKKTSKQGEIWLNLHGKLGLLCIVK